MTPSDFGSKYIDAKVIVSFGIPATRIADIVLKWSALVEVKIFWVLDFLQVKWAASGLESF